jgi:hypothetical protein
MQEDYFFDLSVISLLFLLLFLINFKNTPLKTINHETKSFLPVIVFISHRRM